MTDNPYLARHSSAAGGLGAESWRVAPAYGLFAFVTIYVLLSLGSLPMNVPVLILAGAIALSGAVNGHLWLSPRTYFYDCVMLILVAAIAYNDAKVSIGEEWTTPFLWYIYVLIAIGLLLSFFFPETFGHIGSFSRESRGEVTLLAALGVLPMLGPLGFHQLATGQGHLWRAQALMLAAVPLCLALFSATRGGVAAWGVLAIAYALLYSKHFGRVLLLAACFLTIVVGLDAFIEYFTLGYAWYDLRILNGRGELWQAHIMAFLKAPIFGAGAGLVNRLEYDSLASSEIGVLRWFSEYGLICGLGIVFILWRGAHAAYSMAAYHARERTISRMLDLVCPFMVFYGLAISIFNGYARMLTFDELFYYYSLFYCIFRLRTLESEMAPDASNPVSATPSSAAA